MSAENAKTISRETIEIRAYELYLERGCLDGYDLADWLAAEIELMPQVENEAAALPADTSLESTARRRDHSKVQRDVGTIATAL